MRKSSINKTFLVGFVRSAHVKASLANVGPGATFVMAMMLLVLAATAPERATAVEAIEPMIDRLVKANFQGDYLGAGVALRELVEFERAAGIEPSGKLAVVQVAETQAFADKLEERLKASIDDGKPILAAMELNNYKDILRFEPAGAARAKAFGAMVDVAGQALCVKLAGQAGTGGRARAKVFADALCAAFGMGQADGAVTKDVDAVGRVSPTAAPVSAMAVAGAVKGFLGGTDLQGALRQAASDMGLMADGGELALSCAVEGTSILTKSSLPGTLNFEYGIQIPYSEMQEVCDWKDVVTTQIVEQGGVKKKVTETTKACIKSVRPVDLVRVEKRTRAVPGTRWKRTAIWQVKARFDDGDGCSGQKSFDGQRIDDDFEHNASDPAIGLNPDPAQFPAEDVVAGDVARQITTWLIGSESDCLKAKWCAWVGGADLESVLRCAGIPGADQGAVDRWIIDRFGVTLNELMGFVGLTAGR